jgi:nucleotide-binding universal stress UspA family protein
MSNSEESEKNHRILVAIDGSPHSLAALKLAAELAAKIDAELVGIYVEDVNLIRLADLPITREIGFHSARISEVDVQRLKRQLRAQARRAEQALALIAESAEVQWSFRIAQGIIHTELLTAAEETDLVIMGKSGWSRRKRLGSTAQTMVVEFRQQILILQAGVALGRPIMVIYTGSEVSKKALQVIPDLRTEDYPLSVLISTGDVDRMKELKTDIQKWAEKNKIKPDYLWITEVDEAAIARQVWSKNCGMLVLPAESDLLPSEQLLNLLNTIDCAVYLVR